MTFTWYNDLYSPEKYNRTSYERWAEAASDTLGRRLGSRRRQKYSLDTHKK